MDAKKRIDPWKRLKGEKEEGEKATHRINSHECG